MKSTSSDDFKELEIWKKQLRELQNMVNSKIDFVVHRINYIESSMKYKTKTKTYGIVGNRTGFTYEQVKTKLDQHNITPNDVIVSGGAIGVDTYANRYAKERGCTLLIYYPNPRIDSPKRFFDRNIKIAIKIDELIAFNKKAISGTIHTINRSKALNKKVTIYKE